MTVGEFAVQAGVPAKTLRYYEDLGLLVPRRTGRGWRDYDASELVVLQLTAVGKRLGLSLAQIKTLVDEFRSPQVDNTTLATRLQPHHERLRAEIEALRAAETLLETLVDDCPFRRC